jgi:hypothetical protein
VRGSEFFGAINMSHGNNKFDLSSDFVASVGLWTLCGYGKALARPSHARRHTASDIKHFDN